MKCEMIPPFPSKTVACPAGQKEHIRPGQRALTVGPRNLLDDDRIAAAAIDTPHGVKQKNQKSPERNEFEPAFGKSIVPGRRLMAAGTNRSRTFAWPHGDLNALVIGTEAGLMINESGKTMTAI